MAIVDVAAQGAVEVDFGRVGEGFGVLGGGFLGGGIGVSKEGD